MLDVVDLFREQDTRDEPGLATVHDAFSDRLFAGTESLWTLARYFIVTLRIHMMREATPGVL